MPDVHLAPSSVRDLRQLGDAYKGGDKVLQKRLRSGLQAAAKPLSAAVVREGSDSMPAAGGLRARIAASKGAVTASLAARQVAVVIRATNRQKDALGALDSGKLRHPVFGEKRLKISAGGALGSAWVQQDIPAHKFTEAFDRNAPLAQARLRVEMQKALVEIAREA